MGTIYRTDCGCVRSTPEPSACSTLSRLILEAAAAREAYDAAACAAADNMYGADARAADAACDAYIAAAAAVAQEVLRCEAVTALEGGAGS